MEDLDRKVYVGAINLSLRKVEFFEKGNLFDILMASCAIPPFLPYYKFNNSLYLDCGPDVYSSIREADKLGANKIIVIKTPKSNNNSVKNPLFALKKMFDVILDQHFDSICNGKLKDNIYTIHPKDGTPKPLNSLKYTKELIEAGEESGEEFLKNDWKDLWILIYYLRYDKKEV